MENLPKGLVGVHLLRWLVTYPVDKVIHSLNNWGQDDKCYFCKENPETLLHLLFHCLFTVAFWNDFWEWWFRDTQVEFNLTPAKVFSGVINNSKFCTLLNLAPL